MSQFDSFLFLKADGKEGDTIRPTISVDPSEDGFQSGVDYIKITIKGRNLEKSRPWVTRYPAVHFRAHNKNIVTQTGDELDFNTFLAPDFLSDAGAHKQNMERVLQSEQTALGPIAYKSGLQLEFGLFGTTSSDHLGTALGIFQELSQHASSAFVSQALPFSGILNRSIDIAMGSGNDMKLDVGFKGNVSSLPGPGVYAVVWKGKRQLNHELIHVNSNTSLVHKSGTPFRAAPYIVFEVERKTWRDDWEQIPELREPWENVRAAGRANHFGDFEAAVGVFKRACILSRDLCRDQIDLLRKFADDIVFDAKETFESSYESADSIRFDSDPGSMSAAFTDMYDVETVSGETDESFESMASIAPSFIIKGATKIFTRKARDWKARRGSSASAAPSPSADTAAGHEPAHTPAAAGAFARGLEFVLRWEGGFVDDPDDPGGRTNKGVTQKTYDKWRKAKGLLSEDVLNITDQEVHAIYLQDYWRKVVQTWYPDNLAIALFDSAVNMGPRRAVSMLQHAINETRTGQNIGVDGIAGNQTYTALRDCISSGAQSALLDAYVKVRRGVYHGIVDRRPRSAKFLNGWLNRLNDLASFVGTSGGDFESFGEEITPHITKRIEDLGADDPLEKPLDASPRPKTRYSAGAFESLTAAATPTELKDDTDDLLGLDEQEERHARALEIIFDALDAPWQKREENVLAVLNAIRAGRDFDLLHIVATEAERDGTLRQMARTFRAQALIELGLTEEAIDTLYTTLDEKPEPKVEREVRGLIGRSFKSIYLASLADEETEADLPALEESIYHYYSTYKDYGGEALWHGVNALALLKRTDAIRNPLETSIDRDALAQGIIAAGIERINTLPGSHTVWDRASVAEAHIALGDWPHVEKHLADYIRLSDQKFMLASTLRQFKEVWQLDSPAQPAEARRIIAELHSALAATPGASFELTAEDLESLRDYADTKQAGPVTVAFEQPETLQAMEDSDTYETVIANEAMKSFSWAQKLVDVGSSIALVRSNRGNKRGTAFVINGEEFLGPAAQGRFFVMTNEHVVSPDAADALKPKSVVLEFTGLPGRPTTKVMPTAIWSSPRSHHDATILEVEALPEGAKTLETQTDADDLGLVRHVTVIGHPMGRDLEIAVNNLQLVEHNGPGNEGSPEHINIRYKSSTDKGNSGSPVFDWDTMGLLGIHHKGHGREGLQRLKNSSLGHVSDDAEEEEEELVDTAPRSRRRGGRSARARMRHQSRTTKTRKKKSSKRLRVNQGIWLESVKRAIRHNWPTPPQI